MSGKRRQTWSNVAWVAIFAVALWIYYMQVHRLRLTSAEEAPPASSLQLMAVNGQIIDLAAFRGEVVVLNAWASWCGPCRSEIPAFSATHAALQGRGMRMFGVNVEGLSLEEVARVQRELGMTYPGTVPHRGLQGTFEPSDKIPQTWIVDRQGRIRANHVGPLTESALRAAVMRLLDEPEQDEQDRET